MGCEASTVVLNMSLIPQAQPVAAINSIFCNPDFITLHLHEKFWSFSGDDFTIKDVNTGVVWFRIECKVFSIREKKTLLDCNDVPIVNMKEDFSFVPSYNVYAGKDSSRPLFDIEAKFSIFETFLRVEFTNVVTGQRCRMGLEGDWCNRKALIWLDRGMTGIREPVGRVFRPQSTRNNLLLGTQDYYLEIAPNVDVALMTLICIVLDEKATD
ncbi:Tubby c-terminal-like domain, partial [Globisporangium splendens]